MHKKSTNVFSIWPRKVLWGVLATLLLCIQIVPSQIAWWPLMTEVFDTSHRFLIAHPFLSPLLFIILYLSANACCLPINTVLRVISGMLFGLMGIGYTLIASILGAYINYSMGRYLLGQFQVKYHQAVLERIEEKLQQHPVISLLILRWVPVFPAWLVSMVAGYLRYRTTIFFLTSLLGFIPACCLYVYLGARGYQLLIL